MAAMGYGDGGELAMIVWMFIQADVLTELRRRLGMPGM